MDAATLDFLIAHAEKLTPAERGTLEKALELRARGYRANRYMNAVRPNPHPRQRRFLADVSLEVMYGGSAGGGKSDALLLAALQYVDVPGYAAIIFRRTLTDLALPGALMNRAREWFSPEAFPDVVWSAAERRLIFPEGGSITFGFLETDEHLSRYRGAEFQFIAIDELNEHPESYYRFLISRIRKPSTGRLSDVPLRVRATTNPGGKYSEWVRKRFIPDDYHAQPEAVKFGREWHVAEKCEECQDGVLEGKACFYCGGRGEIRRTFIPARLSDNPSINREEYLKGLRELTPVERARLEHGDWLVSEAGGLFRQSWFRRYTRRGGHFVLHRGEAGDVVVPKEQFVFFITADTASTERTTSDYTVVCVWGYDTKSYNLVLVDVLREKMEVPKIAPCIVASAIGCQFAMVENKASGIGVIQELRGPRGRGLTVKEYNPGTADKIVRSARAQIRMEAGQVFLPEDQGKVIGECLNELLSFPNGVHDDFVDCLSMAANYVGGLHDSRSVSVSGPSRVSAGPLGR